MPPVPSSARTSYVPSFEPEASLTCASLRNGECSRTDSDVDGHEPPDIADTHSC